MSAQDITIVKVIPNFDFSGYMLHLNLEQCAVATKLLNSVKSYLDAMVEASNTNQRLSNGSTIIMRKLQDAHKLIDDVLGDNERNELQEEFTRDIKSSDYKFTPVDIPVVYNDSRYVMNQYYPHDVHRIKKDGTITSAPVLPTLTSSNFYPIVLGRLYHRLVACTLLDLDINDKDLVVDHLHQDRCDWNVGHLDIKTKSQNSNNRYDQVIMQEDDVNPKHMRMVKGYRTNSNQYLDLQSSGIYYNITSGNYYKYVNHTFVLMNQYIRKNNEQLWIQYKRKSFGVDRLLFTGPDDYYWEYFDGSIEESGIDNIADED